MAQTTVTIASLFSVNGVTTSGSINLANNANTDVLLYVDITVPSPPTNVGTITIFHKRNNSAADIVPSGGYGGQCPFYALTQVTRSFSLNLMGTNFDNSGGYLYAEYKTYSGTIHRSANLQIVKNTTTNPTNPNPNNPAASPMFENVPYGGIPLLPQLPQFGTYTWAKSPHGFVNYTTQNVPATFPGDDYSADFGAFYSTYVTQKQSVLNSNGTFNFYYTNPLYLNVYMPYAQSMTNPYVYYSNNGFDNKIHEDQYIPYGSMPQTIIGDPANVTLNRTNTFPATYFQWQKRIVRPLPTYANYPAYIQLYGWKDIPGATQLNYTPTTAATEVTEYRRLILDNPTYPYLDSRRSASSNVVTIYPMSDNSAEVRDFNVICCDQSIYPQTSINPITGNVVDQSLFYYQWQIGKTRGGVLRWENIPNSDARDYQPLRGGTRENYVYKFRRIAISRTSYAHYFSNIVTSSFFAYVPRLQGSVNETYVSNITISPNPTSDIVKIESVDPTAYNIKLIDSTGKTAIIKMSDGILKTVEELNISAVPSGIYLLVLETPTKTISKKIIKQ